VNANESTEDASKTQPSPYNPAVKFDDVPSDLPQAVVPEDVDLTQVANIVVEKLNELCPDFLTDKAIFRDVLTFTDSIRTLNSRDKVYTALKELIALKNCSLCHLSGINPRRVDFGWVDVNILFSIQHEKLAGSGAGIVSVL
jgi:hypothetical protein